MIMCNVFLPWNITNTHTNPNINTNPIIIANIYCLLFEVHCSDCFMYSSQEPCGVGTITIILIFEVRNLKHREVM